MRILIDTNVLLSYAVFESKARSDTIARSIEVATQGGNSLLIPAYCINEAYGVAARKAPGRIWYLTKRIQNLRFEHIPDPEGDLGVSLAINEKDLPVLRAAVAGRADVIVSGDAGFFEPGVDTGGIPVLRPGEFVGRYGG